MWPHEIVVLPLPFERAGVEDAPKGRPAGSANIRLRLVLPLRILLLWEVVARLGIVPAYNFPPPSVVLSTLIDLARSGVMFTHLAVSAMRVLSGFLSGRVSAPSSAR